MTKGEIRKKAIDTLNKRAGAIRFGPIMLKDGTEFLGALAAIGGDLSAPILSFIVNDKLSIENMRQIAISDIESL